MCMSDTHTTGADRRRFLQAVGAGTAVSLAGCLDSLTGGGDEGGEIPIGVTADMTGPTSFISEAATGISYYLEYVNENKGGLDEDGNYTFRTVVRDGAEDVQSERQAFEFYRDQLNAALVHLWATPANVALAPDVAEAKIPEMGQSKSEAWAATNEYMHLFGTSYEDFLRVYLDWAKENKGNNIAVLYSVFGAPVVERVLSERSYQDKIDVNITNQIQHGFAPSDLTSQMQTLKDADPDFIVHVNVLEGAAPAISALNELDMDKTKYGTWNWSTIPELFDVVDDAEGIYGTTPNPVTYPPDVGSKSEVQWYLNNVGGVSGAEKQTFLYNGWAKGKLIEEIARIALEDVDPAGELPTDDPEALRAAFQEAWGMVEGLETNTGVPTIDYVQHPLKGFTGTTIYQAQGGSWESRFSGSPQHPFEG